MTKDALIREWLAWASTPLALILTAVFVFCLLVVVDYRRIMRIPDEPDDITGKTDV